MIKPSRSPCTEEQSRDLLEASDDRCSAQSILLSSQIEPENWYKVFENPNLADAILDRIMHGGYKINLTGESIRKKQKKKTRNVGKQDKRPLTSKGAWLAARLNENPGNFYTLASGQFR